MKVGQDVLTVLSTVDIRDTALSLGPEKLSRDLYLAVNKVIENMGGKWNRSRKAHIFEENPCDLLEQVLLTGEITDRKKELQYFPTPRILASDLYVLAGIKEGQSILEPSAGQGAIAEIIRERMPKDCQLDVIELDAKNREVLDKKKFNIVGDDFLSFTGQYDRIVANPPFSKQQDIDHVLHMYECLKLKGRLVSVMSAGVSFRQNKKTTSFRELLDHSGRIMRLEEGAFAESGTQVNAVVVTMDKM